MHQSHFLQKKKVGFPKNTERVKGETERHQRLFVQKLTGGKMKGRGGSCRSIKSTGKREGKSLHLEDTGRGGGDRGLP